MTEEVPYAAWWDEVVRACERELASFGAAHALTSDELASDVMEAIGRDCERGRGLPSNVSAYARRAARWLLLGKASRRKRLAPLFAQGDDGGEVPVLDRLVGTVDAGAAHHVATIAIDAAIDALDEADRVILRQTLAGRTTEQIAALFGTSVRRIRERQRVVGLRVLEAAS